MIKSEELMIGDWIYDENRNINHQVGSEDFYLGNTLYFKPIPVTPEILEKNGWEHRPTGYVFHMDGGTSYDNTLWYIFDDNTLVVENAEFSIKYIHELQHALRLCGITKNIEL